MQLQCPHSEGINKSFECLRLCVWLSLSAILFKQIRSLLAAKRKICTKMKQFRCCMIAESWEWWIIRIKCIDLSSFSPSSSLPSSSTMADSRKQYNVVSVAWELQRGWVFLCYARRPSTLYVDALMDNDQPICFSPIYGARLSSARSKKSERIYSICFQIFFGSFDAAIFYTTIALFYCIHFIVFLELAVWHRLHTITTKFRRVITFVDIFFLKYFIFQSTACCAHMLEMESNGLSTMHMEHMCGEWRKFHFQWER